MGSDIERAYRERLLPAAAVMTPNLGEASVLTGRSLATAADVDEAARELAALGAGTVVVTGGADAREHAVDVVISADGAVGHLVSPWVATRHVRGSGCTFAAATTAGLGHGLDVGQAVRRAKDFVTGRLRASDWPTLEGSGPVAHWFGDEAS